MFYLYRLYIQTAINTALRHTYVEKQFIYKTRFGAKQISTKVITQNSFRKFSIVPACVSYRMTFYMQIESP